jgi:heme exporter protein A
MYLVPNLERRIEEVVSQVQLESRLHDRVGTLSHGLQRRAAIARAVMHNPSILLLDEPETGLDPHATTMMREVMDTLNSGDRTVLMTTHNLERGIEIAGQVAVLHEGSIVYQASKEDIDAAGFREIYDRCTGQGA